MTILVFYSVVTPFFLVFALLCYNDEKQSVEDAYDDFSD